jgi:NHLM bacteriocin system ABC transporter ATP-binding protein
VADDPLSNAADAALREVLEPSGVDSPAVTGSDVVNALVLAARSVGFEVHPARVAQVGREGGTDLRSAARRLGVPVREVVLDPGWWSGDSGPYVVQRQDGRFGAAVGRAGGHLLVIDSRATRIDEQTAASLGARAWTVTPRLPDHPTGLRQLAASSIGPGTRWDIALALTAAVGTAVLGIAAPALAGYVVGGLVELGTGARTIAIGVLLVLVALASTGLALLESILLQRVATRLDARAVAALLDRLVRLPLSFYRNASVGSLVQRVLGVDQVGSTIASSLLRIVFGVLLALAGVVVMVVVSPTLAAQVCLLLGVIGIAVVVILVYQAKARERYVAQALELSGTTLSLFAGISKIRVAGAESRMEALWTLTYARQQYAARDTARGLQWLSLLAAIAPILVTLTVVMGSVGETDALSLGAFTSFVAAASQTAIALAALLGPLSVCIGALPILRAVRPVLSAEPEPLGLAAADPDLHGGVELADVSFRYQERGPNVLENVSLRVSPGEFVAIVGPSGSGKSTLLRVLIGLERPTTGEVLFDGRPIDRLGPNLVRRQIGAVAQSAQLASGSILDNIVGATSRSEADAWAAAELAGIADDIRAMPMGMRTLVSDGAASFSGGQKQRILLARALVRQPRILLLDESTSALDNHTQSAIAAGMRTLGATRIVVAHRLSTIRHADRIYLLDGGSIAEQGTFDELMASRGAFRDLARRQLDDWPD